MKTNLNVNMTNYNYYSRTFSGRLSPSSSVDVCERVRHHQFVSLRSGVYSGGFSRGQTAFSAVFRRQRWPCSSWPVKSEINLRWGWFGTATGKVVCSMQRDYSVVILAGRRLGFRINGPRPYAIHFFDHEQKTGQGQHYSLFLVTRQGRTIVSYLRPLVLLACALASLTVRLLLFKFPSPLLKQFLDKFVVLPSFGMHLCTLQFNCAWF